MTKQEIFNKVWDHFIVNKGKKSTEDGFCVFRGDNGAKCVVGLFIPDEKYEKEMDLTCNDVDSLCRKHPFLTEYLEYENKLLFNDMQYVHDITDNWYRSGKRKGEMKIEPLEKIAKEYNLTIPTTKQKETTNEKKLTIDHSNYNIPRLVIHG